MKSSGVLIIDNYYCAFYSGCKVLEMGLFYNYFSTNKRVISKYNHKDLNIKHSSLFFNEPHLLGISSLVELIIDICQCEFDLGCEVLDQNNTFQMNISTDKGVTVKQISQELIIVFTRLSFKEHHLMGLSSLAELIIDKCRCEFDPGL